MKVKLGYIENEVKIDKKFIGISEVEIRQGYLELWIRDDQGVSRIEISVLLSKISYLIVFKHLAEKNMNKVKQRKAKIKRGPYFRSSNR